MKIGIISMQRIVNYGSFMQALALKETIESLGHAVEFVDYTPSVLVQDRYNRDKKIKKYIDLKKSEFKNSSIGSELAKIFGKHRQSVVEQNFIKCYSLLGIGVRERYHTKVDILVVGSDEVFNCLQQNPKVGYAMDFFGKGNRAKKIISYAASFGSTTIDKIVQSGVEIELKERLQRFSSISVRDANSARVIKELTDKNPVCHLDPVLIGRLEEKNWRKPKITDYLVVYGYKNRFSTAEGKDILDFAKKKGLSVIVLAEPQLFCDNYIPCRPDEILGYVKNASYVVTDTFHGTIFSTIFHKSVAVYCRKASKSGSTNAEKLLDLLNKLGMTGRLVSEKHTLDEILSTDFDYSNVEKIRNKERVRTLNYLTENLSL